jgi:hypothetical protein
LVSQCLLSLIFGIGLLLTRGLVSLDLELPLGAFIPSSERIVVLQLPPGPIDVLNAAGDDPDLRIGWRCYR